jgi:hypothetical protein
MSECSNIIRLARFIAFSSSGNLGLYNGSASTNAAASKLRRKPGVRYKENTFDLAFYLRGIFLIG